jgi:hypothetical protein
VNSGILRYGGLILGFALVTAGWAPAQEEGPTATDRIKALAEPDQGMTAKLEREKQRAPFEIFRMQVAPFEVLPYVKPHHWSWVVIEARANLGDYSGLLQTAPDVAGRWQVTLDDMPQAMIFRRDARMAKGQVTRMGLPVFLPRAPRNLVFELTRPDAIRPDMYSEPNILKLETHQMIVPVLAADTNIYANWSRFLATVPAAVNRDTGPAEVDRMRYYRLATPLNPGKAPPLAGHPLVWTTTSHLIWDGLPPSTLDPLQQQAMIDWLHWGGQIIVMAAGPSFATIQDSFLGPYLPARPSGVTQTVAPEELEGLSRAFRPPFRIEEADLTLDSRGQPLVAERPTRYRAPEPIRPAPRQPFVWTELEPKPNATPVPWPGSSDGKALGVEWRVGQGRVLMLGINLGDPAMRSWPGLDTFVRRVVFRRPHEDLIPHPAGWAYPMLDARQLSWVRYLARDEGLKETAAGPPTAGDLVLPRAQVAAWTDTARLPDLARRTLEKASGITIPGSSFVLKVVLAYLLALVPINWLICRFVFRRSELAWIAAPLLSISFAVIVERAAAYDMGFDRSCDEIDLLEIQGGYDRAHLSRFASVYTTGRDRDAITYPSDPASLALPMAAFNALRGEEYRTSVSQSQPDAGLSDFLVQPRSLALFRSESMVNLGGTIALEGEDPRSGRIRNSTELTIHQALLIDLQDDRDPIPLGTIPSGSVIEIAPETPSADSAAGPEAPAVEWANLEEFLSALRQSRSNSIEHQRGWRLIGYAPDPHPGQKIEPAVDRHRGVRLVVVHLRFGPLLDAGQEPYYAPGDPEPVNPPPINADLMQPENPSDETPPAEQPPGP